MKTQLFILIAIATMLSSCNNKSTKTMWLDEFDLTKMEKGWNENRANLSSDGNRLTIEGQVFQRGVGTHAISKFMLDVNGQATAFKAMVGIDDETNSLGTVEFFVLGDKNILWQSGVMTSIDSAKVVDVDLTGIQKVALLVTDGGDGINYDHADWANAYFETTADTILISTVLDNQESYFLTPPTPETPKINDAKIVGH